MRASADSIQTSSAGTSSTAGVGKYTRERWKRNTNAHSSAYVPSSTTASERIVPFTGGGRPGPFGSGGPRPASCLDAGVRRDRGAQHLRYRPAGLGRIRRALERRLVRVRHPRRHVEVHRGDRETLTGLLQRDRGFGANALRGEPRLAELGRQRHRKAAGVGRRDQLLRVRALPVLEARAEGERRIGQHSAVARHPTLAVPDAAVPGGATLAFHDTPPRLSNRVRNRWHRRGGARGLRRPAYPAVAGCPRSGTAGACPATGRPRPARRGTPGGPTGSPAPAAARAGCPRRESFAAARRRASPRRRPSSRPSPRAATGPGSRSRSRRPPRVRTRSRWTRWGTPRAAPLGRCCAVRCLPTMIRLDDPGVNAL